MATFVLVHGGGHGGWCWQAVACELRRAGHEVFAPTLTGLADRAHLLSPEVGLDTHITDIVRLIEFEDLSEVILVGHSYGGMVVTGAADRLIARIRRLIYLDAAIPHDGESLIDVSPGLLALAGQTRVVDGVELGLWPDAQSMAIYGIAGHPCEQWSFQRLTAHPWKTVTDRLVLQNPEALAQLPRTIVNCRETLDRRPDHLRSRWTKAEHILEIDAPHDLMLTDPAKLASLLSQAATSAHEPAPR